MAGSKQSSCTASVTRHTSSTSTISRSFRVSRNAAPSPLLSIVNCAQIELHSASKRPPSQSLHSSSHPQPARRVNERKKGKVRKPQKYCRHSCVKRLQQAGNDESGRTDQDDAQTCRSMRPNPSVAAQQRSCYGYRQVFPSFLQRSMFVSHGLHETPSATQATADKLTRISTAITNGLRTMNALR